MTAWRDGSVLLASPATYIPIGDSRVSNGASDGAIAVVDMARGWHVHLQRMLGGRIIQIRNAGVSGNTTAMMRARMDSDVIAYAPGWCLLMGPVNDIVLGVSSATTKANVQAMYAKCKVAGIKFATGTISAWTSINTAAMKSAHVDYNNWVKAWCYRNGIPCADEYSITADPSTGLPVTGTTYDTNHYSDLGAAMVAQAWYDVLLNTIPKNNFLTSMPNDYDNLVYGGNGNWTVGALPSGWTQYSANAGSPTNSIVARTDMYQGSLAQFVGTAAAQGGYIGASLPLIRITSVWVANTAYVVGDRRIANDANQYVCTTAGTTGAAQPSWVATVGSTTADNTATWTRLNNFIVGDVVYAEVEYFTSSISGGNLGFQPACIMQAQGVSGDMRICLPSDQATRVAPSYVSSGVLRSRTYTIMQGCTGFIPYVYAVMDNGVTGTVQFGRIAIKHVVTV